MPTLADQVKSYEKAGFSTEEISAWTKNKAKELSEAGFSTQEIAKDLGYKEVNLKPIRAAWETIINLGRKEHEKVYSELEALVNSVKVTEVKKSDKHNKYYLSVKEHLEGDGITRFHFNSIKKTFEQWKQTKPNMFKKEK